GNWTSECPRLQCSLDVETPMRAQYEQRQEASRSKAETLKCKACGHTRRWHEIGTIAGVEFPECRGLRGKSGCACPGCSPPMNKPRNVKISEEPYLGCIGYSWDPMVSMTIPTTMDYWQNEADWAAVKQAIADFHADPNIDFGGQNFGFDAWWLAEE